MITDSMLKEAAAASADAYMKMVDKKYFDKPNHTFSPEFERKIDKLKRKADHPILYSPLYRVASIILALFIGCGVWLTVDTPARAAFFGWIKNTYEHYFVYKYDVGSNDVSKEGTGHYELTWIPEGYKKLHEDLSSNMISKSYVNEEGMVYSLFYTNSTTAYLFISSENATEEKATVNGIPADLYISSDSNESNTIVWRIDDTIFGVDGFLDKNDLIKAAESVREIEK